MKALKFLELKELLQQRVQLQTLACSLVESGIPLGAITEISGPGKTQLVLRFLAEHPQLTVAWLEESFSICPFSFLQNQVSLSRVLFVDAGESLEWAALQALRSQCFAVLVMYTQELDLQSARRIQLAAEKANAAVIWLSSRPQELWTSKLEITTRREYLDGNLQVHIRRKKF